MTTSILLSKDMSESVTIPVPNTISNYDLVKEISTKYLLSLIFAFSFNDTDDVKTFIKECKKNSLRIVSDVNNPEGDTDLHIKVNGPYEQFRKAFGITLYEYVRKQQPGQTDKPKFYYSNKDPFTMPSTFKNVNIIGLNNLGSVGKYIKILNINDESKGIVTVDTELIHSRGLSYFKANQIASLYNYPANYNGAGQTIAIIELGGGYKTSDLTTYFNYLKLAPKPTVISVSVDGGKNDITDTDSSFEVALDIQIIAAIAPGAKIVVYFAPNTTKGFYDAIAAAINDKVNKPSIISISWGAPEDAWAIQSAKMYDALFATAVSKGINIFVASGDAGSSDGETGLHVDFPSSSPSVVACGGTTLNASANVVTAETVWNSIGYGASGGGISNIFNKPSYQNNNGIVTSKRCVPDIAGDADPNTGYLIYMFGSWYVGGGTSAVAPLMAGLTARLNQHKGSSIGFMCPKLYTNKPVALITSGNNGAYHANSNGSYCLCTGLGRVIGSLALTKL